MPVTTDNGRPPCIGELLVTRADRVLCMLPAHHTHHNYPDGTVSNEPTYHQGAWDGRVYVWRDYDEGTIRTLRGAGFHEQCDHHAVKLAVMVTP